MAVSEIRTQIYLQRSQHQELKRAAARRSISMAQVVREAIAEYLRDVGRSTGGSADRHDPAWSLLESAREIGGSGDTRGSHGVEEDLYGPVET